MPMLPVMWIRSVPRKKGSARAAASRSAMATMSASAWIPSDTTTNSSPPKRATVSPDRSAPSRRRDRATSSASPAGWPLESLMSLKRSRSMKATTTVPSARPRRARAWWSRSLSSVRFGRPVSGSWRAWWASFTSSSRRRAIVSLKASATAATSAGPSTGARAVSSVLAASMAARRRRTGRARRRWRMSPRPATARRTASASHRLRCSSRSAEARATLFGMPARTCQPMSGASTSR